MTEKGKELWKCAIKMFLIVLLCKFLEPISHHNFSCKKCHMWGCGQFSVPCQAYSSFILDKLEIHLLCLVQYWAIAQYVCLFKSLIEHITVSHRTGHRPNQTVWPQILSSKKSCHNLSLICLSAKIISALRVWLSWGFSSLSHLIYLR